MRGGTQLARTEPGGVLGMGILSILTFGVSVLGHLQSIGADTRDLFRSLD